MSKEINYIYGIVKFSSGNEYIARMSSEDFSDWKCKSELDKEYAIEILCYYNIAEKITSFDNLPNLFLYKTTIFDRSFNFYKEKDKELRLLLTVKLLGDKKNV